MSTSEKLDQMMRSAELNEERVQEYIQRKQVEAEHRAMEIYARAVYESMNDLARGDKEKRDELIDVLYGIVKAME